MVGRAIAPVRRGEASVSPFLFGGDVRGPYRAEGASDVLAMLPTCARVHRLTIGQAGTKFLFRHQESMVYERKQGLSSPFWPN